MASLSEHVARWASHRQPRVSVDHTTPGYTEPNPLANGFHCPVCGTRLDKADRPCPFGPHPEEAEVPC